MGNVGDEIKVHVKLHERMLSIATSMNFELKKSV